MTITKHTFGFRHALIVALLWTVTPSAPAADWPNYRGPDHNGITHETDWQAAWGEGGHKELWKKSIGIGFASMAVADGRVYTSGNTGKEGNTDIVFCFDAQTGREIWTHAYDCPLEPKYYDGGTLATPTVDSGNVYALSKMGDLFCLDASTGKIIWQKQLNKTMGYKLPTWHFSSSVLVVDDRLVLNMGGAGLALNKMTGEVIWTGDKEPCGYATPVPGTVDGRPGLVIFGKDSVFAVNAADGKQQWKFAWKTKHDVNAADPILSGSQVFISSGYGRGCALLEVQGDQVKKVWESKVVRAQMNATIQRGDYLYGFDEKTLKCIKLQDGSEQWQDKTLGKGSLIMSSDGRLIIMSEKGELVIAQADPGSFKAQARSQILPSARCWTSPVLANGKIYARNAKGDFVCVDVSP